MQFPSLRDNSPRVVQVHNPASLGMTTTEPFLRPFSLILGTVTLENSVGYKHPNTAVTSL